MRVNLGWIPVAYQQPRSRLAVIALVILIFTGLLALPAGAWAASISGQIADESGNPLDAISVYARGEFGDLLGQATTGPAGTYAITGLTPGVYRVEARDMDGYYVATIYPDLPALLHSFSEGVPIELSSVDATGIDIRLPRARTISGHVRDAGGVGLSDPGFDIRLVYPGGLSFYGNFGYLPDGAYTITGLPAGAYQLATNNFGYLADEWYGGATYIGNGSEACVPVDVTLADASDIDFDLAPGVTLSGRVLDDLGSPVDTQVSLYDQTGGSSIWGRTNAAGDYSIRKLPAGVYQVRTANFDGYPDQWYSGVLAAGHTQADATPIEVAATPVTGIDFVLSAGFHITGRVTNIQGAPLEGVWLGAHNPVTGLYRDAVTAADGTFTITHLQAGTYTVGTSNGLGYVDESRSIEVNGDLVVDFSLAPVAFPDIVVSPSTVLFGDVRLGESGSAVVSLRNTGVGLLGVTWSLQVSTPSVQVTPGSTTIAPGDEYNIPVSFLPTVIGAATAVVAIETNVPGKNLLYVLVSGNGVRAALTPLEEAQNLVDFYDRSIGEGNLQGVGNGSFADKRAQEFRRLIVRARDFVARGKYGDATELLGDIYAKCDGLAAPPDWVQGPARFELAARVVNLNAALRDNFASSIGESVETGRSRRVGRG